MISVRILFLTSGLMAAAVCVSAADVRRFEENGSLIEETRQTERTPVAEVQMQNQQVTRYTDRVVNDLRPQTQSFYVPVTEYRLVPRIEGRWNPFVEPRLVYDRVPYTRYELRTTTVNVPVTRREQVPETQTVQVPVRTLKFVDQEKVSRVVLGPAGSSSNPTMVAQLPPNANTPTMNLPPSATNMPNPTAFGPNSSAGPATFAQTPSNTGIPVMAVPNSATYGPNLGATSPNPTTFSQTPANMNMNTRPMNAPPSTAYGPTPDFYSTNPAAVSQAPPATNIPTMNMQNQPAFGSNPTATPQNGSTYGPSATPTFPNGQSPAAYGPSASPNYANGQNQLPPNAMAPTGAVSNSIPSQTPTFAQPGTTNPPPGPVFSSQSSASMATLPPPLIGGISRFDSDPPRQPQASPAAPSLLR